MARVWFDRVTRRDARLLCKWWNAHSKTRQFWIEKHGRIYDVMASRDPVRDGPSSFEPRDR